jgi:hypothetical protein
MRTKTLLLSAGALLAAGFVSSQAQPVYSQNIVGYATVATPGTGGTLYMQACPFVIGVSNGANEVYGLNVNSNNLPIGTQILIWNATGPNANTFSLYYYDPSYEGQGYGGWWDGSDENNNVPTPVLPPGQGYFFQPTANATNTFAGTVAVSVGGTNKMSLTGSGGTLWMVGSVVPYAGDITNANGLNLNNLAIGSQVLTWNATGPNANSYTLSYWDPSYVSEGYGPWWDGSDENNNVPDPTLSVGNAFFVQPSSNYQWVQTVPSN